MPQTQDGPRNVPLTAGLWEIVNVIRKLPIWAAEVRLRIRGRSPEPAEQGGAGGNPPRSRFPSRERTPARSR
ncbi:MAG TPA: hypothetical protein PKD72_05985 [Gemmatales bacterium]|nr:hypothetical protein [Gemmatales bacterium]